MFTETLQIGIAVRDLEEAMHAYWEQYGVGPWSVLEMNPSNMTEMVKDDEPREYGMRCAVTMVGSVQRELLQPTDDRSIYADFLAEHGEGLHHVLVGTDESFDDTVDGLRRRGRKVLMAGNYKQRARFAYLPTAPDIKVIAEIAELAPGADLNPEPDAVYPSAS